MIDEPTTEERLAALLARRSGKADRGPAGRRPKGGVTPMRSRQAQDGMPPPPVGRSSQPAPTPFDRSFDRWPGSWDDAPRPPAPASPTSGGPSGSVFDFDTPGWPAPGEDHLPGPTRSGPARRLLADNTMPLAAVPSTALDEDTVGDRLRGGAERWVRSWSPSRLVASGASAVSFAAMVVAMGPLLQPDDEAATEAGTGETDAALASAVEAPAVSISVDPLAGVPGTPLDATGQPVPLSGTAPDGALPATASSVTVAGAGPASSTAASAASTVSTTKPAAGSPATSAAQGTNATAAPTTPPPATAAPTTAKPGSTAAPTTQPPATAAPTTQAPTTAAPTTQPATTAAPTTAKPTTTAPPTTKGS